MKAITQLLLLALFLPLLLKAQPTQQETTNLINLAGKQRMLTQKMSKEALLIAKEINIKENREALQKTISLFDTTLKALLNGNTQLKLIKTEDKKIKKHLIQTQKLWREFKPFIDKIVAGTFKRTSLKAIEMGNMPLLNSMNSIVKMYEEKYTSNLKENHAITINLAGKERMLSQKMTKELLFIAHKLESKSYMNSLKRGGEFFKDTLFEFMQNKEAMSNPHTSQEIKDIKKLWEKYQHDIANTELSKEGLHLFSKKEKIFAEEMTSKLIIVASKIDKKRYQDELKKSAKEFDSILNGLINGDAKLQLVKTKNQTIQKELNKVKKLWKSYKSIILNVDTSNSGLEKAMKLNMIILKTMDKTVELYTREGQ